MKAIIMAGGEGTRLRPLTCDCPKPMMRLFSRPVMEYSLSLLAKHGVTESAVTLGYLPGRITDYFGAESHGVKLHYYTERTPLGTAGGVKNARDFLTETFCVLSGDGVTDIDLSKALEYHRAKKARATIILKRVPDPMAYGLVLTEKNGLITRFLEKPSWGEVISDTINTGIYILEPEILDMITDVPCDFGRDLFPILAAKGMLHGCVMDGYWCDIGDINAYIQVHRDALDGNISLPGMPNGHFIHPSAHIDPTAAISSPSWIGPGAVIGRDARVGPYTVMDSSSSLAPFSSAKRAILWPGASLEEGAQARGCVMAMDAILGPCASAFEGSVMGTGAKACAESEIAPETFLWPGRKVMESVRQDTNLVWGQSLSRRAFHNGVIDVHTPGEALRFAEGFAVCRRPREVLLAREPSSVAAAIWHGCACGLMAQGVYVLDAGVCTPPQLRYALSLLKADGALLAGRNAITPLAKDGLSLPLSDQRKICTLMARQEFPQPFSAITHPMAMSGRSEHAYIAMLASAFTAQTENTPPVAIHSADQYLLSLAERAFDRAGINARCELEEELMEFTDREIGLWLDSDGAEISISTNEGLLSDAEISLLRAWTALQRGEKRIVQKTSGTRAVSILAEKFGAEIIPSPSSQPAFEHALMKKSPFQLRLHTDALFFGLSALAALANQNLTLKNWRKMMPEIHRSQATLPIPDAKRGSILRTLCEQGSAVAMEDGVSIRRENGFAWITPDESRPECLIVSESRDAEIARELCDFCENALKQAIESSSDALQSP